MWAVEGRRPPGRIGGRGSASLSAAELVTNALKYALPEERAGTVSLGFRREADGFVLTMADDGVGFDPAAAPKDTGLGSRLVRALVAQLGSGVEMQSGEAQGRTVCVVRFPARPAEPAAAARPSVASRSIGKEPRATEAS